jgi:transcriptional regulator with PAS, ATPase and Fis domain
VLDDDGRISADDLASALHHAVGRRADEADQWPVDYAAAQLRALREFRAEYVTRLLERHGGNVSRAAVAAKVSRRTLHRWLAELKPENEEHLP